MSATRKDWKTTPLPAARASLLLDRVYSADEFAGLKAGLRPRNMGTKWFIFFEEPWLYLHRAWTGHCIFQVRFETAPVGVRVVEALVNRDPKEYDGADDAQDASLLAILMDGQTEQDRIARKRLEIIARKHLWAGGGGEAVDATAATFPDIHRFPERDHGPYEGQMGKRIVGLLRLFTGRVPDAESNARVLELATTPRSWSAGHAVFSAVRSRLLDAIDAKDRVREAQYSFEELCCKALYNATSPRDPFDPSSAFFVAGLALGLARAVGVSIEAVAAVLAPDAEPHTAPDPAA